MSDLGHLDRCETCQRTREWHEENNPLHPYNDGSAGARAFLGASRRERTADATKSRQRGSEAPPWPFDPVLRQALINKGVLTPEDLRDAEDQIRAVTSQFEATTERRSDDTAGGA